MKKIIILSYDSGTVYVFDYLQDELDDTASFFDTPLAQEYALRASNCEWMIVDTLNIHIQTGSHEG